MNRIFDPVEPIDLAVEPAPADAQPAESTIAWEPVGAESAPGPESSPDTRPTAIGTTAPRPDPTAAPATSAHSRATIPPRRPDPGAPATLASAPAPARFARLRRPDERLLLIGALCGVCIASVAGSLLYFGHWSSLQQAIAQERNLLLLERLRSLGPANPSPVNGPEPAAPLLPAPAAQSAPGVEGLPPPPPQEAWIEQLSTLPPAAPSSPRVLTVPVSPRPSAASPPPARSSSSSAASARPAASLPQLVGVVAGAGRTPSAIFLVGGNSMSVASGEPIGSTGWRLRSAEGETALIERGGELRQVSIASGNGF